MESTRKVKSEQETRDEEKESLVRLTTRDKELLAHVATARYLTLTQLRRLVFTKPFIVRTQDETSRTKGPTEIVCRRRVARLCSGPSPYLRRLHYHDNEGVDVAVFAADRQGHAIARQVLRRAPIVPMQDLKAQFLHHTVTLNNLYVTLAEGCARLRVAPARYPFWWISTEPAGLPWHERNESTGQVEERRIVPDAILELTGERARIFLECEMGGHPLVRRGDAPGSAFSKLQRYAAFMLEGGQQTFYMQKYPDGWKAELVFLVHSGERAANLAKMIDAWRERNRTVPLVARALSFSEAEPHFCERLRLPAPPEPGIPVSRTDLKLTCAFVAEVTATFKAVRQFVRANPALRSQGCPYPEYTPDFERMVAMAERLRAQLGSTR